MGGGVSGGALAQTCPAAPAAVPPTCTPASPPRSSTHPLARACQPTALKTPRGWPTTPSLPARVCTGPLTPLAACASFLILTLACVQLLALAPPPCMVLRSGSCPIGAQPPPHCVPCAPPPHCTTTFASPHHPAHTPALCTATGQTSVWGEGWGVGGLRARRGWGRCAALPPPRAPCIPLALAAGRAPLSSPPLPARSSHGLPAQAHARKPRGWPHRIPSLSREPCLPLGLPPK